MNRALADYTRQADHDELSAEMQAFLARGGQIEVIPVGFMAESLWTPKQRANPQMATKAQREAEKAQAAAVPAVKRPERAAVGVKEPKPKAQPKRKPSPAMEEAFTQLKDGDTAGALAERLGKQHMATWMLLNRLRTLGRVRSKGVARGHTTWHKVPACP